MHFLPMLNAWQWLLLGLVPPAIVALYFLKLRRQPLEVPSTLLWRKAIEDLHVNSLWQRIRQSLLLYLQVLFVLLLLLTLLRPNFEQQVQLDDRVILMLDNSASMSATDIAPTRLAEAKLQATALINQIGSNTQAMVISFSDTARVEKSYTSNRSELLTAINNIQPTQRTTNALEALRQAAALANPQRAASLEQSQVQLQKDEAVAPPLPATLYILSDGRFPSVQGFSLGNLTPKYLPIGSEAPKNLGITTFTVRRKEDQPAELQAFAEIQNSTGSEQLVKAELLRDGRFWDATTVSIKKNQSRGIVFDLREITSGALELRIVDQDQLALDNRGFALIQEPNPLKVLLVTTGNPDLERSLATTQASKLANVRTQKPDYLKQKEYQKSAASGGWDLIIYDRCSPDAAPRANTMTWGDLPPTGWTRTGQVANPLVLDVDRVHPLSQNLDWENVLIANSVAFTPPPSSTRLVDSTKGSLLAIGPRDSFEDVVLGFAILGQNEAGESGYNTNFHLRSGFPLLMQNLLEYFSRTADPAETITLKPGHELELRQEGVDLIEIKAPSGKRWSVNRSPRNTFNFSATEEVGIYEILANNKVIRRFAVQLADSLESNIMPVSQSGLQIGYNTVTAQATGTTTGRNDLWKWVLLLALVLLLIEWYIYNKRVYV